MDVVYNFDEYFDNRVIFAERKAAERHDQIRSAIESAETWAEFKDLLPAGEWDRLQYGMDEPDDDEEAFDAESVPGYGEGDYPEWLAGSMMSWFPPELVAKYRADTALNGFFLDIPQEDADEVVAALEAAGHTVEYRGDLDIH